MTRTKGIAFERLTMNANRPKEDMDWIDAILLALISLPIIYAVAWLILGWN